MDWEDKVELVKLGNQNNTPEGMVKFKEFTLKHMENFDIQAWGMFSNLVNIIESEMEKDVEYWGKVYNHLKTININDESLAFRSGLRLSLIQTIYEENLSVG